jgi:hypothetical protein
MITLCNFWHRSYSWPNTQHIQKLATEVLWFLSYCRSSVFTVVFFMQNLKGISSGQNNKSCSLNHNGSNKIGFTFLWFSCDFIGIFEVPAKTQVLFNNLLLSQSWTLSFLTDRPLVCRNTLGRSGALQSGPQGGRPARAARFRRSPAAGSAGEGKGVV